MLKVRNFNTFQITCDSDNKKWEGCEMTEENLTNNEVN